MEWNRITINVEDALYLAAKERAKARRQSMSGYIATLIENDARAVLAEAPAGYGASAAIKPTAGGEDAALVEALVRGLKARAAQPGAALPRKSGAGRK